MFLKIADFKITLIDPNPYQPRLSEDPSVVAEIAEKWEIKFPKTIMKMAEKADAEIASISIKTKKE